MKGIKKTLMAGVLACTAFNAQAEVAPVVGSFSYGVKIGGSITPARINDEAKINSKKATPGIMDSLFVTGSLYGEYAITDYMGFGIEAGYWKQGSYIEAEGDDKSTISMISHGITTPLYLSVYPFGREEEDGIFKICVGAAGYFPLSTSCENGGKELDKLSSGQQAEVGNWDIAPQLRAEYEFSMGLSLGASYGYGLKNRFKVEDDKEPTVFKSSVSELKSMKSHYGSVHLGFNIASLFSE